MSKILKTVAKVNKGFKIINKYTDETTSEVELFVDDVVSDLKYVVNSEVETVSGRISDVRIVPKMKAPYKVGIAMFAAPTEELYKCEGFLVDFSEVQNSQTSFVSAAEVLEYQAEDKEVASVSIDPVLSVDLTITLSDETEVTKTIKVGDELNLKLVNTKVGVVETSIRVDEFVITRDSFNDIGIVGIQEVKEDGNKKTIAFTSIKGFGEESDNTEG